LAAPAAVEILLETLAIGSGGPTDLRIDTTGAGGFSPKSTSCANCGETDSSANPYSCCPTMGNCTWKAEQMRSGDNNFSFGGVSNRDAYRWMSLAATSSGFAQGGTIPTVGAVMVFIDDFGGRGHVATVKGILADGGVSVTEQRCDETCTEDRDYGKADLVKYLAGYIYTGSSAPAPLAKTISSTGETVIPDYTSTSSYYFGTYGPGCAMSYNGGERMWGTFAVGLGGYMHFICSKTGTSENFGRWRALIQTTGLYEIQAWIPNSTTLVTATGVKYEVNGTLSSAINQATSRGKWVKISNPGHVNGYWSFSGGVRYNIYLRDTNNGIAGQFIAFDDIKFIRR
jgi:surface antigen